MAVDYARAMAAYTVAGEGGDASSQYMVGFMYYHGRGVDAGYKQALAWFEKAAAQDVPVAILHLGTMYFAGLGVTPSCRRAREFYERAIELGHSGAVQTVQALAKMIQKVTS